MRKRERHGYVGSKTYAAWKGMLRRCNCPQRRDFKWYGGRGIKVCAAWRNSFSAFLRDMGEAPEGMTLDRINNGGDYKLGNCRWATWAQQRQNKREGNKYSNSHIHAVIRFKDEAMSSRQWEQRLGLSQGALWHRMKNGWSLERALTTRKNGK